MINAIPMTVELRALTPDSITVAAKIPITVATIPKAVIFDQAERIEKNLFISITKLGRRKCNRMLHTTSYIPTKAG